MRSASERSELSPVPTCSSKLALGSCKKFTWSYRCCMLRPIGRHTEASTFRGLRWFAAECGSQALELLKAVQSKSLTRIEHGQSWLSVL